MTRVWLTIAVCLVAAGCRQSDSGALQGYVEGEFVFVAAPYAGQLKKLHVARGAQVEQGALLFELDDTVERAAHDEADRSVARAQATLADLQKGQRPSEIASLEAQLGQARAARVLSEAELKRVEKLAPKGAASDLEHDRARSTHEQDVQHVSQLESDLVTARLGAREDRVAAEAANLQVLQASQVRAAWDQEQMRQSAPFAALVFDTIYREGEWVDAGRPVLALLPPRNVKVRAFVPEPRIGAVRLGDRAEVSVDGVAETFAGTVSFVSPQAEYTPPVIYSRETRDKLVFLIEVRFPPEAAARLHPGQPVDVRIAGH
jgi:HlyD family secretion protein